MENAIANYSICNCLKNLHLDINTLLSTLLRTFFFYFQPLVTKHTKQHHHEENVVMSGGDIMILMERLGIPCESQNGEKLQERYGESEVSRLFEEEPSVEEIREAFDIFDDNKDGLIDGHDLQRVLCLLGLNEELCELEKCRDMIMEVQKDGNGNLDFNDFLLFMEKSFC